MVTAEASTGNPGAKARDARDVQPLLGFGHGATEMTSSISDARRRPARDSAPRA